jgi:hypothetical protein
MSYEDCIQNRPRRVSVDTPVPLGLRGPRILVVDPPLCLLACPSARSVRVHHTKRNLFYYSDITYKLNLRTARASQRFSIFRGKEGQDAVVDGRLFQLHLRRIRLQYVQQHHSRPKKLVVLKYGCLPLAYRDLVDKEFDFVESLSELPPRCIK